jgi:WD40 repeat protein
VVRTSEFSPDGKRVLTASDDGNARLWDVAPAQAKRPDWLLQLAEAVSGQVLNSQSVLEPTKLNRAEVLNGIRYRLKHEPDGDDWAAWGGWFLANASMRTISPFSKVTVPEYVDRLLEAPTAQALAEAESLAFGSPELLQRIAVARQRLKPTRPSEGN